MPNKCVSNSRYIYVHDTPKSSPLPVDIHHILHSKIHLWKNIACFSAFPILLIALCVLLHEDKSTSTLFFYLSMAAFFIKLMRRNLVDKESVVIIPAFGVQLETHYRSGRVVRCFVPIDNILKAVLNECVTPVTCYWTLALILREEEKLTLIFKASRPPLKMLLPVWESLCAATETGESRVKTM